MGAELGLDEVHAQLLPADKVERVEALLKEKSDKGALVFVGDGINDAPVLSRADVGVAMGGMGSDAAIEAADVVFMDDKPSKLADAIRIAPQDARHRAAERGVRAGGEAAGDGIGARSAWPTCGRRCSPTWGVSVIAILNAMRALRARQRRETLKRSGGTAPFCFCPFSTELLCFREKIRHKG